MGVELGPNAARAAGRGEEGWQENLSSEEGQGRAGCMAGP